MLYNTASGKVFKAAAHVILVELTGSSNSFDLVLMSYQLFSTTMSNLTPQVKMLESDSLRAGQHLIYHVCQHFTAMMPSKHMVLSVY